MPVVFREQGFRFHFLSNEGDPREPVHIHVRRGSDNAKFWLSPSVALCYNYGFNARTLSDLEKIVVAHRVEIEEAWNDYFG